MIKTYEASGKTVEDAIDAALVLANTTLDNVDVEVLELGGRGVFGFGRKDARVRISLEVADAKPAKPQREEKKERPAKPAKEATPPPAAAAKPAPEKPAKSEEPAPAARQQTESGPSGANRNRGGNRNHNRNANNNRNRTRNEQAEPRERAPREDRSYKVSEGTEAETISREAKAFLAPIFNKFQVQPEMGHQVKEGILWLTFTGQGLGSLIGRRGETLNALQYLTNLAVNRERKEHVRLVLDVEGYRAGREETLVSLAKKMAEKAVRSGRRVELEPMNPHERRIVHLALQNDKRVDTMSQGEEPYRRVVISRRRNNNNNRARRDERPAPKTQPPAQNQQTAPEMSLSEQLAQQFDTQINQRR